MTTLIAGLLMLNGEAASEPRVQRMLDAMCTSNVQSSSVTRSAGPFAAGTVTLSAPSLNGPAVAESVSEARGLLVADARFYGSDQTSLAWIASELDGLDQTTGDRLHGDFALAHWNGRRLLLVRDQFGIRPLQYTLCPGEYVAFASLPSALLQTGLADRTLDAATLTTYPMAGMAIAPRTYFHAVKSVAAAHTCTFDTNGTASTKRYWRLPLAPLIPANTPVPMLAEQLGALLDQAVKRRLAQHGATAAHLSGGLDSGAIAALAATALSTQGKSLEAFCLAERRDDPGLKIIDELPYAQSISDTSDAISLHSVSTADQIKLMGQMCPDLFMSVHPEEPEEQILRAVSAMGGAVILSGWGGDEAVTWRGHGNLAELFWTGQWPAMMTWLKKQSEQGGSSKLAIFRKAVLSESLPGAIRNLIRARHGKQQTDWRDEIADMVPSANREKLDQIPTREYAADSRVQRRGGMEHWSLAGRLETFAQRGARHGVSYAFPMLDLDLLRFAVRIPAVLLKDEQGNRAVFRRAMQGVLPDDVCLKAKKLTPYPAETLRQSCAKPIMLKHLGELGADSLAARFIDIPGVSAYISKIREPAEIRTWMNEMADKGEQVVQHELYHVFTIWLAWYLDQHGADAT